MQVVTRATRTRVFIPTVGDYLGRYASIVKRRIMFWFEPWNPWSRREGKRDGRV